MSQHTINTNNINLVDDFIANTEINPVSHHATQNGFAAVSQHVTTKNAPHTHTTLTHAGRNPQKHYGAVNIPVFRMSTVLFNNYDEWHQADHGKARNLDTQGYAYGRHGNPTTIAFASVLAQLEGGDTTFLTSCGLGAIVSTLQALLAHRDHVLVADNVYGPTRQWFLQAQRQQGIEVTFFHPRITAAELEALIQNNTRVLFVESPGSVTFEISDIPALTAVTKKHNIIAIGDNTWGTPLFFKPFEKGLDISIHAVTKYIMGHSDGLMGAITCSAALTPRLKQALAYQGLSVNADDAYNALRGLRTLHVRLPHHQQNGIALAQWCKTHAAVAQVWHPALPCHVDHALWKRDFLGSCGLFGLMLHRHIGEDAVRRMINALQIFGVGYSWGGYESLILPCRLQGIRSTPHTHDGQILRIHAGLEHIDDLIADLNQAFAHLI